MTTDNTRRTYMVPRAVLVAPPFSITDTLRDSFVLYGSFKPEPPGEPAFLGDLLVRPLPADPAQAWLPHPPHPALEDSGQPWTDRPMFGTFVLGMQPQETGPETREAYHARLAEKQRHADELAEAWRLYDDALRVIPARLGLGEQGSTARALRAVWDLHAPTFRNDRRAYPTCTGCDEGSYAEDPPEWPCSTVAAIAKACDVPLPDHHALAARPDGDDQ